MSKQKPLFSIVLIARNEERTLLKLNESLTDFKERKGEIILVDTGSTDSTVETAKNLGFTVFEKGTIFLDEINEDLANKINEKFLVNEESLVVKSGDKVFNFDKARNFAASCAKNDYIMSIDADEYFTKMDIDTINDKIREGYDQFEYEFTFSHDEYGNPAIQFRQCKFYNRKKIHWVNRIHEIVAPLKGQEPKVIYLTPDIYKIDHYQNVETNRNGYLKGLALDCYEHPDNDRHAHYFARELFWSGRLDSAEKEFIRHVEMNKWPAERSQSLIFLGDIYTQKGDTDKALEFYHQALSVEPNRREPWIKIAEVYYRMGKAKETALYASTADSIPWTDYYANQKAHYTYWPSEMLYWALWYLGDTRGAKKHFLKALSYQPENKKYLEDIKYFFDFDRLPTITLLIPTLGRSEGLNRILNSIIKSIYPKDNIFPEVEEDLESKGCPLMVNLLFKRSQKKQKTDYCIFLADDTELTPTCLLEAINECLEDDLDLLALNTGEVLPDKGNINEHFIIKTDFVNKVLKGKIFDEDFWHVGCDNLLWHIANKKGKAKRSENAILKHYHFSKNLSSIDKTYEKGWSKVDQDRELLQKKLKELDE